MKLPPLRLKPHEDRRLRAGHLWVYANEVDTDRTPLTGFAAGALCRVEDVRGAVLGVAYVNPHTLLCARLLSGRGEAQIDRDWIARRLRAALALREAVYDRPYYRLIHGEGDGLPGLVVDRYGDQLVVQINTAGFERLKAPLLEALGEVVVPQGIRLRNDTPMRRIEGLSLYLETIGAAAEWIELDEGGVRFTVPLASSQKTGWFFDQRDNRERLARYARGARVLDLYAYIGAWGLRAAGLGAAGVVCADASASALEAARANADLNGVTLETLQGQALEVLKALAAEERRFELVIVDPPALIKRKRDAASGLSHYQRLNRAALELVTPGGVLVSCSCSFHLDAAELQRVLLRAARGAGRRLQILEIGGQGPDHPVHPAIPETRYLKAFFCRSMPE
ncbi:MAG: class I SAM-dependent rRNA methyltransferase [Gammaproteobacteria bacterium]|nr:class I SAM-dependent rRNA methyltransferase [Gammaproteobacteria bacterium]